MKAYWKRSRKISYMSESGKKEGKVKKEGVASNTGVNLIKLELMSG